MNGAQRRNWSNLENQFPGCTGRMVNLFDLNSGIHSNKLIRDGPRDDDSLRGSDVGTTSRLSVHRKGTDDNLSPWNRKECRIPGKMLSQEDMTQKVELKDNPPNLVAKLKGLDALPLHQSGSAVPKINAREFSPRNVEDLATIRKRIEEEDGFSKKIMQRQMTQILSRSVSEKYKDMRENWQKVTDSNILFPVVDGYNGTVDGKKMSFVRQKFMEAKCLATDEKLRQSEEFHDALEFLSSNRDLFVRFLQEPNSLFSKNLYEFYTVPPSPGTKRITVLRSSKIDNFRGSGRSEKSSNKQTRVEQTYFPAMRNERDDELTFQPTRIVVLKPNNGKIHGIKRVVSPPGIIHGEQSSNEPENNKTEEFRRLAGEITDKIRANLTGNRVNKISTTTVFSNGCSCDDSSFNKSENEYAVEKSSDSEFMSPSLSHSWSYVKSCGGPFLPSFSRTLCSPESSLSKEAKKRLSRRWAMIASHGNSQEQRGRKSNTLGEMLALSETKKSVGYEDESRKQSILESSTMCGSGIKIEKGSEEVMEKNDKSSLRGKVSSLFFSRNKKLSKDADNTLHKDEIPESSAHHPESRTFSGSTSDEISRPETCLCSSFSAGASSDSIKMRHQRGIISREKESARLKPLDPANLTSSRHQPGPTSVLDPPFDFQQFVKSIIDKSSPIESIARTVRDGSYSCTSPGPSFHASSVSTIKEEERNFLLNVQTLLTMARLESNSFTLRWHSLENPLDPSLRDRYANLDSKEWDQEAKLRKLRSNRILVFDCVITALLEVTDYRSAWNRQTISNCRSRNMSVELSSLSMDRVLAKMKEWFNRERFDVDEGEESGSQVVESVVRKKVVGREWVEHLKREAENSGREMEERLMEEMVEEAVIDFVNDI